VKQRQGLACGCLALLLLSWAGIALWVLGFMAYCQYLGALAAICDFVLYGSPEKPAVKI